MNAFAGTGLLTRIVLRRDRVRLGLWLLGVPLLGYALAVSVFGIYPDEAARRGYAVTSASSLVARAFNGPIGGAEMGAVVVAETYATAAVIVALLSTFAVVRHTRQNEETGRAELLGSSVVGRYALLTSALLVVVGVNVVATVLLAVALVATGLPVTGCIAAAAAIGGVGLAFTAVAAVTAQLTVTSRGANALAAAAVGIAFLRPRRRGRLRRRRPGRHPAWRAPGRPGSPRSAGETRYAPSPANGGGRSPCRSRC